MRRAPRGSPVPSCGLRLRASRLGALVLALVAAASLPGARALAQSATFLRSDHPFMGNNVVVADLNGDGLPDLAGIGAMAAAIMLGNGNGTFQPRTQWPVATWAQDLAVGDFSGDGRLDLAVTLTDPDIAVSLLVGNGDGTFGAPVNLPNVTGFDSPAVVATDVDGDGLLDLVLGNGAACFTAPCRIATTIVLMRGNGDGTFRPGEVMEVGSSTARIAVGDFNRDGKKDLALASSGSRVHVLLGSGDGTFAQQTLTLTADTFGVEATDVDVADLNRDSVEDLVVAIALNGSRTAILLGNGDGTFAAPRILTEPEVLIPHFQAVADYNGDGLLDLALSLGVGDRGLFEIRRGLGDGNFLAPERYLVPPDRSSISGYAIAAADLNRDGKPDLALGIVGAAPAFATLVNSTGTAPPPTPGTPTLLSPANDSRPSQPVRFDWSDVAGASSYQIQVDNESGFATPRSVDKIVTPSELTAGTLNAGVRYWWRVRGVNAAGTPGPWSSVRRFTAGSFSAPTAPAISAFSVSPSTVVGGNGAQGTVTLSSAAPSGGAVVALSSTNTGAASVPASVTIPAGSTGATFAVTTSQTTVPVSVTIGGTYANVTWSVTLTVNPPAAPASLSTVAVNPSTVTGGASAQGTVTLTSAAPSGGFAVALSSSHPAATVPASVTVAQGSTSATFPIGTSAVSASTAVIVTTSAAGVTRTATLTVAPPAQAATLTVTATGRSGERVLSSPTGVNVSVGSTGSASFPVGTAITLSVSNGRDAIWSGACSSGGNKARTCAFTLSANASVTANVQ